MARVRVSTTVDEALLKKARRLRRGTSDAALIDEALDALLRQLALAESSACTRALQDLGDGRHDR